MTHTATSEGYASTADTLVNRIKALVSEHPEILEMQNPFALFKIDGFNVDDLKPSLFQASWALAKVKEDMKE